MGSWGLAKARYSQLGGGGGGVKGGQESRLYSDGGGLMPMPRHLVNKIQAGKFMSLRSSQ